MLRMLQPLRAPTPTRMKKKLKMPTLKLWSRVLPQPEATAPFLLLDPALLKPTSPLLQLHLPAALLPLLPLKLCITENFEFYQIPGMPGAVVRYTLFPLVCYLNKF
jgi:hypothetical protein